MADLYDILLAKALGGGSGGGGGGGRGYTLIKSVDITVDRQGSTSSMTIGTYDLGEAAITGDKILYVRISNKNPSTQHFQGSSSWCYNVTPYNPQGGSIWVHIGLKYAPKAYPVSGSYGIWVSSITTEGVITVQGRYNGTSSSEIDGDYTLEAYLLDFPDGDSQFDSPF